MTSECGVLRVPPTPEPVEVSVELPVTQHTLVLRKVHSRVAGGGHSSCAAQEGFQCADSLEGGGLMVWKVQKTMEVSQLHCSDEVVDVSVVELN